MTENPLFGQSLKQIGQALLITSYQGLLDTVRHAIVQGADTNAKSEKHAQYEHIGSSC